MDIQEISTSLLECVHNDDVIGARSLIFGVNEEDRKSIVANINNLNAPLFVAALRGNVDMVKFLVKECKADKEERGRYYCTAIGISETVHLVTPLWCAAISNKLEVVELLISLGADINAASDTGNTPLLYACKLMNVDVVKYLILHGADVKKADSDGETCLMIAIHHAIASDDDENTEDIVQLLIDHDSDPYMRNKDGDDAFQKASLCGQESILLKLLLKFELPAKRWIESYELLGTYFDFFNSYYNEKVFSCWENAVKMRRIISHDDVQTLQPNPVYQFAKELNTVEELEALFQDPDSVNMHALMLRERILDPNHRIIQFGLQFRSDWYIENSNFRRGIDILKYAYQLQNARVEQLIDPSLHVRFIRPLCKLCFLFCKVHSECHQSNNRDNFRLDFEDVFEVLQMATSNVDEVTGIIYSVEFQENEDWPLIHMKMILRLMKLITELIMDENQKILFYRVIYRLVRSQPRTHKGQTLLHLSVKQSTSEIQNKFCSQFPNIAVVELLLECGANVNAVDDKNNTALHLCSKTLQNNEMKQHHELVKRIVILLLNNEAHLDMKNISGDIAAKMLTSSLMEMNMQDFVKLKCLAASAVVKYEISYVGHIPAELTSFVRMHGMLATKKNLPE